MNRSQWRDRWSIWLWLFTFMLNFSFALALWGAFDTRTAVIDFLITTLFIGQASMRTPLEIEVKDGWLHVGAAKIETKYIRAIEILNAADMARARTQDADPDAYLAIRFWVKPGLKIYLNDKRDYTPYWLISTQRGAEIKTALAK